MSDNKLFEVGGPPLLVLDASAEVRLTSMVPPTGTTAVARLDGGRMPGEYEVFEQFSDTMSFPAYFGWNWNALSDCLRDLSWWPADRYLIVIDAVEEMLATRSEERAILFSILRRAAREWANPLGKTDGMGIPFKVLLLASNNTVEG